jgi:hypothetical protein
MATEHVRVAWQDIRGHASTRADVRSVLSRIQIDGRAAHDGAVYERDAKQLLRVAVLADPSQADLAWDALVALAQRLTANRQRAQRDLIRDYLLNKGVRLQSPRSYRADIDTLIEQSTRARARLSDYALIRVGGSTVRVERAFASAITTLAADGSLLIVGAPGTGKSGILIGVTETLIATGHDVVVLDAPTIFGQASGSLRVNLGIAHDLVEVLANWSGPSPAFLVMDALDAMRGESASEATRLLISEVQARAPRWHILASIREYELRYNPDLAARFPLVAGDETRLPSTNDRLGSVRHMWIGGFNDRELFEVAAQSSSLASLIESAPQELLALLRSPFNLRIAAELLDSGTSAVALRGMRLRIELLERYWEARVIATGDIRDADGRGPLPEGRSVASSAGSPPLGRSTTVIARFTQSHTGGGAWATVR